ncbi:HtaA domain-containing protein [Citricoccus nitrophenolicus]|uniref:HtaA domain-containing protein n=1 Tax=Citricoccus nitrophenolicus TaxID=863575 RepID=UPI0031EF570B
MVDPSGASRAPQRASFGLAWAVKESFVAYIRNSRDGQVTVEDGAGVTPDGRFLFPLEGIGQNATEHQLAFRGKVRFRAHFGLLSVTLETPRLLLRPDAAELAVTDHEGGWRHLAHLDLPVPTDDGPACLWADAPAGLAEAGVELFGDTYHTGEQLAPVTLRLPASSLASA